jgi:hypothetical protein
MDFYKSKLYDFHWLYFYFFNFYRNVGPFRKRLYNEDHIEMNNSIACAIPVYHDTVLNTDNGGLPKTQFVTTPLKTHPLGEKDKIARIFQIMNTLLL